MTTDPAEATVSTKTPDVDPVLRSSAPLRLLAVHAHPDDESSKGAATMARYAREGVDVLVATLTGGERGDILNQAMERPEIRADLAAVRRAEMARAREILGVRQLFSGSPTPGCRRATRCRRSPTDASPWSRWRRPRARWSGPSGPSARR